MESKSSSKAEGHRAARVWLERLWRVVGTMLHRVLPSRRQARRFARGVRLESAGDLDGAVACYETILDVAPGHLEAFETAMSVHFRRGDRDAASGLACRFVRANPETPAGYLHLGRLKVDAGDLDGAIACYKAGLAACPGSVKLMRSLGTCCLEADRLEDAARSFHDVLRAASREPDSYYDVGQLRLRQGRSDDAMRMFEQALTFDPRHVPSLTMVGILSQRAKDWDRAIVAFGLAAEAAPEDPIANQNLGNILLEIGELQRAKEALDRAREIAPERASVACTLACIERGLGNIDKATERLREALTLDPKSPYVQYTLGLFQLAQGNLPEGWDGFDYGLVTGERDTSRRPLPWWDGGDLGDSTILVTAEQGIGDEIMFSACLPDLVEKSAPARCLVECDTRLVSLFSRSFPGTEVVGNRHKIDHDWLAEIGPVDCQIAIGSLPRFYRRDESDFPRYKGYLRPDKKATERCRAQLAALGSGLKIGISWRGGGKPGLQLNRSIDLPDWAPVLRVERTVFINLQYGPTSTDRAAAQAATGVTVHDLELDPLRELEGFCALVAALDLVISIDNATVHFAGAIGVPVWAILPGSADWRWMLDREDSPWYPSMRLFRRSIGDTPDQVIARVAAELKRVAAAPRT